MFKKISIFIILFSLINIYLVSNQIIAKTPLIYDTEFQVIDSSGTLGEEMFSRLKVPGGWLVRIDISANDGMPIATTIIFLPDPKYEWKIENNFLNNSIK